MLRSVCKWLIISRMRNLLMRKVNLQNGSHGLGAAYCRTTYSAFTNASAWLSVSSLPTSSRCKSATLYPRMSMSAQRER